MQQIDTNPEERFSPYFDDELSFELVTSRDSHAVDLDLYSSKWFDYRTLTPLQATRLYAETFGHVYRRVYAQHIDAERAPHVQVMTVDRLMAGLCGVEEGEGDDARQKLSGSKRTSKFKRFFVGCWHGRQVADAIGMPYRHYIELAFERRLRFWNQKFLPQPSHLYREEDIDAIRERWEEMQKGSLFVASHPAYLQQNYQDIAYQNDHHEWLFKQAGLRGNRPDYFAQFVSQQMLPLEKISKRLEPEVYQRVVQSLH